MKLQSFVKTMCLDKTRSGKFYIILRKSERKGTLASRSKWGLLRKLGPSFSKCLTN